MLGFTNLLHDWIVAMMSKALIRLQNRLQLLTVISCLLIGAIVSFAVSAHSDATGIVKERMEMMEGLRKRMRAMKKMARGKVPFDAGLIAQYANEIGEAASQIGPLFPEGSLQHASEAKPLIWERWDQFMRSADGLVRQTGKLASLAHIEDKREILFQINKVGNYCRDCHAEFREKNKK